MQDGAHLRVVEHDDEDDVAPGGELAGDAATWAPSRYGAVASSRTSQTESGTPACIRVAARPPPDVPEADDPDP